MQPAKQTVSQAGVAAKGAGVRRNRSGRITRTKILDAAEQIFADKGINGASLREIMLAADVNIAAVNYYFGSKADLLKAVIARRSSEINGARLKLLEDAYAKNTGAPTIDDWLHAFITPFIDAEGSSDPGWRNFMRVLNWVATAQGQDQLCHEIVQETYGAMRQSFLDALAAALPELDVDEINWRYYSSVTVLRTVVVARERAQLAGAMPTESDLHHMMKHVVAFLRGGLTAPATVTAPQ